MNKSASTVLLICLAAYTIASMFHYIHNAIFLDLYPNMPDWISVMGVYSALAVVSTVGLAGYLLYYFNFKHVGLIVMGVYAGFGFDGLAHYSLAPISSHSLVMNLTIWSEVLTAALLLISIIIILTKRVLSVTKVSVV